MAKLDQILIKTSDYEAEQLVLAMKGELENVGRPTKVENGEIVIRQDADGTVELWTLNAQGEPKTVSVDISGELPDYDLEAGLSTSSINQIGDVDTADGYSGGLDSGDAGVVLTWDGGKWVARPIPEFGENDALVPTLNEVGDVNYGFYAALNKFGPENGDVLYYQYNAEAGKYQWAPTKFDIQLLEEVVVRDRLLVYDQTLINGIEFGNLVTASRSSAIFSSVPPQAGGGSGAYVSYGNYELIPNSNPTKYRKKYTQIGVLSNKNIELVSDGDIVVRAYSDDQLSKGIRYENVLDIPDVPPDDRYFVTLKHVRAQVGLTTLGSLGNVNDFGILQGQVLGWDSLTQQYLPTSGITPDLSLSSIEDLIDFDPTNKNVRGRPLAWNQSDGVWAPTQQYLRDVIHGGYEQYDSSVGGGDFEKCPPCNEENLGRFAYVGEEGKEFPVVCVRTRSQSQAGANDVFDYVRLLIEGNKRGKQFGTYGPSESQQESATSIRKDPLSPVAYEGDLGALENVNTADVFAGATVVYNPSISEFEMGYPALNLSTYSINALGDVNATAAGIGYGLIWDGSRWTASSNEVAIRLDDLQDVQFGSLGVINTKLVAAYMMGPSPQLPNYAFNQDVSTVLAVSTPKENFQPGTTIPNYYRTDEAINPVSSYTLFEVIPDIHETIAEILDIYVRWPKDESWQTINGDGCIEFYFYPTRLLDNRTLMRRVATSPARGGYILQLMQQGDLRFNVTGPEGEIGFEITTPFNTVSLNNWHHIAMVKQGASNRLYFDGDLVGEATSTTPWTGDDLFVLGRNDLDDNNTLTHNFYRGLIGDFRVTKGRPKYEGSFYTMPAPIQDEILDTSPNSGDFLSYDGTKWTNVGGVEGDISSKSINELVDVDTGTTNPVQGDALVWTGAIWEPGIPGIGAAWALNDFTDVETNYGGFGSINAIKFSQGESLFFSTAFNATPNKPYIRQLRSNNVVTGVLTSFGTCGNICDSGLPSDCGYNGIYSSTDSTYFGIGLDDKIFFRTSNLEVQNVYQDCAFIPNEYHLPTLTYTLCPGRDYNGPPGNDIGASVEGNVIPAWGMIQDRVGEILPYGRLGMLSDVETGNPGFKQVLAWDGNKWSPSSDVQADVSNNQICDLRDVSCTPPSPQQVLRWDGTEWTPQTVLEKITELPDIEAVPIVGTTSPFQLSGLKNPVSTNEVGFGSADAPIHTNAVLGLGEGGFRGIEFKNYKTDGGGATSSFIETIASTGTTVYTSCRNLNGVMTHLELDPYFVRFGGVGQNWGSSGFLLAGNLIITYENQNRTLDNFNDYQVPPKGLILEYVDNELLNLDLSNNILENLGNVDTAGKGNGYALVWDGESWVASPSVAADISLASIGELQDVVKTPNTDQNTSDGAISLDVGALKTSRPHNTLGGIELVSQTLTRIGWDDSFNAAPVMENALNTAGGGATSLIRVLPEQVDVDTTLGLFYRRQPTLSDLAIPSFAQVKQQISRQQTDYTALFLLDGNSFTETVFNWPLTNQITTQPNPVYLSKFDGQYSYGFRKISQDKIQWTETNGCPRYWKAESLWSFECWVRIDSTDPGDGKGEIIFAARANATGGEVTGPCMGIGEGSDRSRVWASPYGLKFSTAQCTPNNAIYGDLPLDEWVHLYFANEGSGRHRFYVNGLLQGTANLSGTAEMAGGLSIGGKTQATGDITTGYLTGLIDDFRITQGFVPYEVDQSSVPVPNAPLEANLFTSSLGTLNQLADVNTVNPPPFNGQVLMWNNIDGLWEPGPPDAVSYDISSNQITNLLDVNTETSVATEGDILYWNSSANEWQRTKVDGNGGIRPINARTVTPGSIPQATDLFAGELFLNMADKKLWALDDAGLPFAFASALDEAGIADGILDEVDTRYDRVVGGTF